MRHYRSEEIRSFTHRPLYDASILRDNDSSWPRISIIVPSFNQAEYLERTIISVLNQRYPDLELLVIDGGSKDGSVDIIKKYEKHISYWVSEKDNGQSDAINKGFKKASGQILAWLNSDDVYLSETLLRVGKAFRRDPSLDVVYGNEYIIGPDDSIIKERRVTSGLNLISKLGFLAGNFGYYQPASFWTRKIYDRVGGIDSGYRFTMDNDLFARFDLAGARFFFIREFLSGFRLHPESKTTILQDVAKTELRSVYEKYGRSKPVDSFIRMNLLRLWKSALYIKQGDGSWLFNNLSRRIFLGEGFNF